MDREWPLRWANRRRRWAAGVPWARCRYRGRREGPAWGTGLVPPLVPTWYRLEWRNLRLNCQWHTKAVCRTLGFRPPRVLHAYGRGRATRPIFDHRETGLAVLSRAGAWSGEVSESDGATGQTFTGPKDFGPLGFCTHIGEGARRDRFSTIHERGRRCLREPAHGLGKCLRAMARRGRRLQCHLPDLRISAPSGFACMLARAGEGTDFRPPMNGVGGAFASRRMVWGSV